MIEAIGHHIAERIRQRPWADRVAGIVTPYEYQGDKGKMIKVPLSCDVSGKECSEEDLAMLLPDQRRRSVIFIEDRSGARRIGVDGPYVQFQAILRIVGWVNLKQIGIDAPECEGCTSASKIAREIFGLLPKGNLTDCNLIDVRFDHYGFAPSGENPWQRYTLDIHKRAALLKPPFEFFGMDIVCQWRIHERCLCLVQVGDPVGCGAPYPVRRRHPKDFTCLELNDPDTGLTDDQREDCLDCGGGSASASGSGSGSAGPTLCEELALVEADDVITEVFDCLSEDAQDALTTQLQMAVFIEYANEAAALADNVTVPTKQRRVILLDTGREFRPTSDVQTVAALVATKVFKIEVTESGASGNMILSVPIDGSTPSIQLNA